MRINWRLESFLAQDTQLRCGILRPVVNALPWKA
jgi:hypothetical protein